jgi:preprotein translocase subunit YajC|tara:strand:+ start:1454 stop:1639 length:186 start_codon:yes stop_codon:yes gene_type:complete
MKLALWAGAILATIGGRGLASLLVALSLVTGVLYFMVRRDRRGGNAFQAATEKLRGLGGQG